MHILHYHFKPTLFPSKGKHLPIKTSMHYIIFCVPTHGILSSISRMVFWFSLKPSHGINNHESRVVESTPFWESDMSEQLKNIYYSLPSSWRKHTELSQHLYTKLFLKRVYEWPVSVITLIWTGCRTYSHAANTLVCSRALFWWELTDSSVLPIVWILGYFICQNCDLKCHCGGWGTTAKGNKQPECLQNARHIRQRRRLVLWCDSLMRTQAPRRWPSPL